MATEIDSGRSIVPRAFLSHSSQDAELVRAVAADVRRPFVVLDLYEFAAGDEILSAIDVALKESAVFVLFASRASLASMWVDVEIDSARYELKFGRLTHVLVCVLDDTLRMADFPEWMRRYKFLPSRAVKPIARAIRRLIDDMMLKRQSEFFVNRLRENADLQEVIAPSSMGGDPANVFAIFGLDGMGRRTLLQRAGRDILSLPDRELCDSRR